MKKQKFISKKFIPIVDLSRQFQSIEEELVKIFRRVGRSGIYVNGNELNSFENEFSKFCDTSFSIGVGNATDGLTTIMKAMNIGEGDEVITADNSFIASAGAIVDLGAIPILCDVNEDLNIDPNKIEKLITNKTKAIMPVHLTGRPAKMDAINKIAKEYDLFVIEDAAQAIGAKYKSNKVGSLGDAAVFSLHPLKNLHVYGDGGVITTKCKYLNDKCRQIRNHGLIDRDTCQNWGRNSRLDEIQAGIALYKLQKIDEINSKFRRIAKIYSKELKNYLTVPRENKDEYCVFHNYVILHDRRDDLAEFLKGKGIDTKIRYPKLISEQPAYKKLFGKKYVSNLKSQASKYNKKILSLPIFPELADDEINYITSCIKEFFDKR